MDTILKYPCGLKAVVSQRPALSVSTGIWIKAGSVWEGDSDNGISHFTEHMMFKGTDALSAFEIAKRFEDMGAAINAFTGKDCTCYFVKSIAEQAEKCFVGLCDIFLNSVFPEEELDRERRVIVEEINMQEDSPEDICYDLAAEAAYDGPLSRTILGPRENVMRFGKNDIKKYMSRRYTAENIVVAFAGNITAERADALIKEHLLPHVVASDSREEHFANVFKSDVKIRIDDYEQSNLILTFPGLKINDPRAAVLSVVNVILGGGMSSRLFQSVREKNGLAYSIYTSPSAYASIGAFNICVNYTAKNTGRVLDAIHCEIADFLKNGAEKAEFERAKAQIKSALVFSQEACQSLMLSYGKLLLLCGELYDMEKKLAETDAVTIDQVNKFAAELFAARPSVAYLGKQPDVKPEWRL